MDTVYPEPMSRLHRRAVRKQCHRGSAGRYRTQPVTFQEIKEVDEENLEDQQSGETTAAAASKSELDLNLKFEEFWRMGREKAKEKKKKRASLDNNNVTVVISTDADDAPPPAQGCDDDLASLVALPGRGKANPRTSI